MQEVERRRKPKPRGPRRHREDPRSHRTPRCRLIPRPARRQPTRMTNRLISCWTARAVSSDVTARIRFVQRNPHGRLSRSCRRKIRPLGGTSSPDATEPHGAKRISLDPPSFRYPPYSSYPPDCQAGGRAAGLSRSVSRPIRDRAAEGASPTTLAGPTWTCRNPGLVGTWHNSFPGGHRPRSPAHNTNS